MAATGCAEDQTYLGAFRPYAAQAKLVRRILESHGLDAAVTAGEPPFGEDFEVFAGLRESAPLAAHFANAENTLIKSQSERRLWPRP